MHDTIRQFAQSVHQKFPVHVKREPEDQLRAPFEPLPGKAVPSDALPEKFSHDAATQTLDVGGGRFGPVSKAVWDYEVSGLKVLQSWLGYRMRHRKGRESSPLDDITPAEWPSDYTSECLRLLNLLTRTLALQPEQAALLDAILAGPLLEASQLGDVSAQWHRPPQHKAVQGGLGL